MSMKLLMVGLLASAAGLFWSATDIQMKLTGKKTMARILEVSPERGRTVVSYAFSDEEGLDKSGHFSADENYTAPDDHNVAVVYLPGRPETVRLASESAYLGFIVLVCGLGLSGWGFWLFKNEKIAVVSDKPLPKKDEDEKQNPFGKLTIPRNRKPK